MSLPITTRYPADGEMNYVGVVAHVTSTVDIRLRFYKQTDKYILISAEQYHRGISATFHSDIASTSQAIIAYATGYGDTYLSQFTGQTQIDMAKVAVLTRPESVAAWSQHLAHARADVYAWAKQYMPSIADQLAPKTERRFHIKSLSPTKHTIEVDVTQHGDKVTAAACLREVNTPMNSDNLGECQKAIDVAIGCANGHDVRHAMIRLRAGATYDEAEFVYIAAFVKSPHLDSIRSTCRCVVDQTMLQAMQHAM